MLGLKFDKKFQCSLHVLALRYNPHFMNEYNKLLLCFFIKLQLGKQNFLYGNFHGIICSTNIPDTKYLIHSINPSIGEIKQPHYSKGSATVWGRFVHCGLLMRVSMQISVMYYLRTEFLHLGQSSCCAIQ